MTITNPYAYSATNGEGQLNLSFENSAVARYQVEFPSALNTETLGNTTVLGEYLSPKKQTRSPLVIILHGMGDSSILPCRLIANSLAKKGIASLILFLVFHKRRMPESIKGKYPRLSAEEWLESYQVSVTDVRQAIDWAAARSEIAKDKIAVLVISFGGFIAGIALGLDRRLKAGVIIEAAGNSDKITRNSLLLRHQYKMSEIEFQSNQRLYDAYLQEVAVKGFENVPAEKSSYSTDPKTFASSARTRPVLMLNALLDEMIPRSAVLDLWEAYGKPPIFWYPATHASIWMWYPFMGRRITRFLEQALL
jgi:dienelactone hydrolase